MNADCENTLTEKKSFMLYFMRKNAVHFRDDAGTTFVIAVMFPCRVVSPLQCKIPLQTAEALDCFTFSQGGTGSSTVITSKCPSQHT